MGQDVRPYRGTEADSDHVLIIAKIQLKRNRIRIRSYTQLTKDLREEKKERIYEEAIDGNINRKVMCKDIHDEWKHIRGGVIKTAK